MIQFSNSLASRPGQHSKNSCAYVHRFIFNARKRAQKKREECRQGPLSIVELQFASNTIIREIQRQKFSQEIALLQRKEKLPIAMQRLTPFLDATGIIRVGGAPLTSNNSSKSKDTNFVTHKASRNRVSDSFFS